MRLKRAVLIASMISLLLPAGVLAHHSLEAQFDTTRTITLIGTVKKIDWSNPHMRLYLDVANADNDVTWEVEMGPPHLQIMNGWKIDSYRRGDHVKVEAWPARDGSRVAFGTKVAPLRR